MGWFRGDENPSSQAFFDGKPKGGLAESLERHQRAAQVAQQARADVADAEASGGNGFIDPV